MTDKPKIKCEFCGDERDACFHKYYMWFQPNEYPNYFKKDKYLCVYCVRNIKTKAENHRWDGI